MLTATKTYMMKNPVLETIEWDNITHDWLCTYGVERIGATTRLFFDYDRKFESDEEALTHHKEIRNRLLEYQSYRRPIVMTESVQPKKVSFHVIFPNDYIVRAEFLPDDEKTLFSSIVGEENMKYIDDSVYHKKWWFRLPYGTLEGKPYPHIPFVNQGEKINLSNYVLTVPDDIETIDYSFTPSRINRQFQELARMEQDEEEEREQNSVESALEVIKKERFKDRKAWFCLATIMKRYSSVQSFCKFSLESGYKNYDEKSCIKTFNATPPCTHLGMLFKWLKEDNIPSYMFFLTPQQRFIKTIKQSGLLDSVNCAKTLKKIHNEILFCPVTKSFYQFKHHRWIGNDEKGTELRNCISELEDILITEIKKVRDELSTIENELRDIEEEDEAKETGDLKKKKKEIDKQRSFLLKEKNKLLDTPFRDKIMKECMYVYMDREFNGKKDVSIHLIGFTNGVLDLTERVFRDGRKEDCITLTTGYDFDTKAYTHQVSEFLSKLFPDPVLRDFHIKYKAHCLYGSNPNKSILFQTNKEGDNGKSTLTTLDLLTFGQYAYTMPSSFLSYVDKGGSGAKADIIGLRGKRLVLINEPNSKLGVNVNHLKEFRGNDELSARGLFEKSVSTFKNQSKMVISCNKLPEIESDDSAFFNSIKVLDFEAKFTENAPESEEEQRKTNHFMINKNLTFDTSFIQGYMRILWETYLRNGIEIEYPYQVEFASRAYQARSDPILSFLREKTKEADGMITYTELFERYGKKTEKKSDFITQVKTYKTYNHLVNGINGIQFREEDEIGEIIESKQKVDIEFENSMKDFVYTKDEKKFKRIQEIIKDFNLPKSKSTSVKVKEFFMRRGVTIVDDSKNGHKVFIRYDSRDSIGI